MKGVHRVHLGQHSPTAQDLLQETGNLHTSRTKETKTRVRTINLLPMAAHHRNSIQIIQPEGEAQTQHLQPTTSLQIVLHQQATSQQQVDTFPGPEAVKRAAVGTPAVDQPTVPSPQKAIRPSTELFNDTPPKAHPPGEMR